MHDDDRLVSFQDLARRIGPRRAGRPTCTETVSDWADVGLQGVRLETEWRGGIQMTTWNWFLSWSKRVGARKQELREEGRRRVKEGQRRYRTGTR